MKKLIVILGCMALVLVFSTYAIAKKDDCVTIQEGTLLTSAGDVIVLGYDQWGYNYQSHMFNGGYCDAYRDAAWCQAYREDDLMMKWNDAWLSNKDCGTQVGQAEYTDPLTPDGKLDRHYGFDSYIGSGAWLTNHMSGTYDDDGNECKWVYFTKIVAVPADANLVAGIWYGADGTEIGPTIWGQFATVQTIYNDPCAGDHGVEYLSPVGPGFGKFKP